MCTQVNRQVLYYTGQAYRVMTTATFRVEAMVRGYHWYQNVWDAALEEQISCQREPTNSRDPFIVVVVHAVGSYHRSHTKGDLVRLFHVSSTRWDNPLSSDSDQALVEAACCQSIV